MAISALEIFRAGKIGVVTRVTIPIDPSTRTLLDASAWYGRYISFINTDEARHLHVFEIL